MIIMLLLVGLLFGGIFGFGAFRSYEIGKFFASFGASQVETVATVTAQSTDWQPRLSSVGSLTAVNGASLSSEIAGIVDKIDFESGADVKAGTLLLTLRANNDPATLAQLQAAAALDKITLARDEKQLQADAISQAQVDTDRANVAGAEAQVQGEQALIAEKEVRAPFAGRLGIRQVDPGQFLAVGTPIVTLEQLNPLFVDFYLPQQALSQIAVGQSVHLGIDAFPDQNFSATITAIDAVVDSSTRTVHVRASLPNDSLALRPGMFATIDIAAGAHQNLVTLPQTAIAYNPYGDTVFTVTPGTDAKGKPDLVAHQVFVTLGDTRGDQVAVLSGVRPGDEVVTAGQLKLRNGAMVVVNNTLLPPNNPNPNPPNE
jgi:membrane fusion protein (multidrug efflux system)